MKILLIGSDFFGYSNSLKDAFVSLGHDVKYIEMSETNNVFMRVASSLRRLLLRKKTTILYHNNAITKFFRTIKIYSQYKSYKPDYVFLFPGYNVSSFFLKRMKVKKGIWVYDSIYRMPDIAKCLKYFDDIYYFEGSDQKYMEDNGLLEKSHFLPLCVDTSIYYEQSNKKEYDICFVGNLFEERLRVLLDVCESFDDLKIIIYGKYSLSSIKDSNIKYLLAKHQEKFTNTLIDPTEANILYSKSKICINIQSNQSIQGTNMRFYEILATKSFQIVSYNPYLEEKYCGCCVFYYDEKDLIAKIQQYLVDEKERLLVSSIGYKKILREDTFLSRAQTIIGREPNI